jgi:hypothetical protein
LANPLAAVQARQIELTEKAQEALKTIFARNLSELSQQLIALLDKS